ncbi:MAG TPA: N-acetyltransferase [Clostridiales bacterium]|jgi:N-acetylglutamate synthase-like GNAT family acetyltransferase|nr:N-acetyltransferase [Clostridiales bacterium]
MELQKIECGKEDYMSILLLADPCVKMIERYLTDGDLYIYRHGAITAAVAVLYPLEDGGCELKNIAVIKPLQGIGIGTRVMKELMRIASRKYIYMLVGTTSQTEGFYLSLGFQYSHTIPSFFTDNYPKTILENGIPCVDMRCFTRKL